MLYTRIPQIATLLCALLMMPGCWPSERKESQKKESTKKGKQQKKKAVHGAREMRNAAEFDTVLKDGSPVVAKFSATWCGPCQSIKPVFEQKAKEHGDAATFVELDADQLPNVFDAHKVKSFPTFIYFDAQGKEVTRHSGGNNFESALKSFLNKMERP